jgi:hypothetical protein
MDMSSTSNDLDGGALVTESANAGTPSALSPVEGMLHDNRLIDAYSTLSPGTPVPQVLVDLEARARAAQAYLAAANPARAFSPSAAGSSPVQPASPYVVEHVNECSNECCDKTWVQSICPKAGNDNTWFLFDWPSEGFTDPFSYFEGVVCAGVGTSNWSLVVDTSTCGNIVEAWAVKEATYQKVVATGSCIFGQRFTNEVNSPSHPHLHADCGVWQ